MKQRDTKRVRKRHTTRIIRRMRKVIRQCQDKHDRCTRATLPGLMYVTEELVRQHWECLLALKR